MMEKSGEARRDHRVVLMKCENYQSVFKALTKGIELLGGVNQFCSPGDSLLLKPNLLVGDHPDRGVTTHPEFFKAVIQLFQAGDAKLFYGDSPAFGSPKIAGKTSGLSEVARSLDVEMGDFVNQQVVSNPNGGLIKQFNLARGLAEVDGVINLPKFKTHGLTRLTGAVKNLFGCLPGVQKAGFHARLGDEFNFSEMLLDLAEIISPRLHIMDGVVGMEGNGPRNGQLRKVGVVLISANPYALDHCVARIMNLDPALVPTLKAAQRRSYYHPEAIEVLGDSLNLFILKDYQVNRSRASTTGPQNLFMKKFKQWVTPRPVIDEQHCSRCGRCVSVCPVTPRAINFQDGRKEPPRYDYKKCIRCYCWQEMCPDEAITIKTPLIGKILRKIKL